MSDNRSMPLVSLSAATFRYPGRAGASLHDASLEIRAGEVLAVAGPTGGGKSTLLKVVAGLLPGTSSGKLDGERRAAEDLRCGVVFQSPDDQIFSSRAYDEVAFGLRNAGINEDQIPRRVEESLATVGMAGKADQDPSTFSGGQKQRLAIAAALALSPALLVLDEPLSQLDPSGATEVMAALAKLRAERGVALILAEHRMEDWLDATRSDGVARELDASRILAIAGGRVAMDVDGSARHKAIETLAELGLRVPLATDVARQISEAWAAGVRDEAGLAAWLGKAPAETPFTQTSTEAPARALGDELLTAEKLNFRYAQTGFGIGDLSLTLRKGERLALLGANGSGKSTLLALLAGVLTPQAGNVRGTTRRGYTFQNPDAMLICETALEEASFGPRHGLRLKRFDAEAKGRAALTALGLSDRPREAPLALSRGQRLRLAAASVLSMGVDVLLLDEPTTGQDRVHIERLLHAVGESCASVVFSTHDVDLACSWADRVLVMSGGGVIADGPPARVLADDALVKRAGLRKPTVLGLCARLGMAPCRSAMELSEAIRARRARA